MQTGGTRQRDLGANAHCHDHQVGRQSAAIGQDHRLHPRFTLQRGGVGIQLHIDAACPQSFEQDRRAAGIELLIEQRIATVQQSDRHAALAQAVGRLDAEQPAANHHGTPRPGGARQHGIDVVQVAKPHDAG